MLDTLEKLICEKDDLDVKITKIFGEINENIDKVTNQLGKLSDTDLEFEQWKIMRDYRNILDIRITRLLDNIN